MYINDLESNLREYCRSNDSRLFEDKIYLPMRYMASSIITKHKVKQSNVDDLINDMVSHASLSLPEKYDETKGNAKAMLYIIMSQYLQNHVRSKKRNKNIVMYLEDLDYKSTYSVALIEITVDNVDELKYTLLSNKHLFESMGGKLQRKIKDMILDCIQNPTAYNCSYNSYTKDIAKKCRVKVQRVYETIKEMNKLFMEYESQSI